MTDIPEYFYRLPKAEIHVHLEGCFKRSTLARWAAQAGVALPRPYEELFNFSKLADFLEFLDWSCGLADKSEHLEELAFDFCRRLAVDGTGYADLIVNPTHWHHWRNRLPEMIQALDRGFVAAEAQGLPPVRLCISLLRTQTAAEAEDLLDTILALNHPRVAALSIDGNEAEAGRTSARFAPVFARAAAAGLPTTVHAGESSGPEGVEDAIQLLKASRIDHGVRAIETPESVALLVQTGTPIGICPSSNINLGVFPSFKRHPIDALRRAGVRISINTDDPGLMQTSLPREYALVAQTFGWGEEEIRQVARTSIEASFAPLPTRERLLAELEAWSITRQCEPATS